jgi:hypothetical protein
MYTHTRSAPHLTAPAALSTARADQLHTHVRDARSYDGHAVTCDALDPCGTCVARTAEVRAARKGARVQALTVDPPALPQPRTGDDFRARLAAARP